MTSGDIAHGRRGPVASPGRDPLSAARVSAVFLAAVAALLGDERAATLEQAWALDPLRAAVIDTSSSVGAKPVAPEWLVASWERRAGLSKALRSSLGQLSAAANGTATSWSEQSDEVIIAQGEASARVGRFIADRVAPKCADLRERLASGGTILDVGTGIGALATALITAFPAASVVGIDIADRPLEIARRRLEDEDAAVRERVRLAQCDIVDLADIDQFDAVWLPAPFLPHDVLDQAFNVVARALRPGGWIIVGTNPDPVDSSTEAVDAWLASLGSGSAESVSGAESRLHRAGFGPAQRFPTFPGGPVLLAAKTLP